MSHITRNNKTQENRFNEDFKCNSSNLCPTKFNDLFGDDYVKTVIKSQKNGRFRLYLASLTEK